MAKAVAIKAVAIPEPNLPWVDHQEDRGFRWLMIIMMVLFLGTGLILDAIKLPELVQKNLVDVSPRLAKLILEKQKVKPPPPKKIIPKKEEKKKEPEKKKKEPEKKKEKPKEKKKPEKKKEKKKEVKKEDARDVAKKSGLIALSDELADLRESFDLDDTLKLPQQTTGKQAAKIETASNLLSAGAQQSSGGIQTDTLNRTIKTSELAQRQTTKVESKIETNEQKLAKASTTQQQQQQKKGTLAKRTADEIERVFQQNKGGIFNLYHRALRKNPSLSGKVVIELTIAPSGKVIAVKILSSELGDEKLERKLELKIKKFKFAKANVAEITVTYPIDFLPS
jgi:TonB family protein